MIVSHVKHLVSFVKIPEKSSCIQLCLVLLLLLLALGLLNVIEEVGSVIDDERNEDCDPSIDSRNTIS